MSNAERQNAPGTFSCIVADDSEFARWNITRIILKLGGAVAGEAKNGREAVEMFARLRPDLVLLDITMPEMDGVEALQKIREQDGKAKVIMISSLGHKEMMSTAIHLGAKHFLTKPYSPDYACLVISNVLDGKSAGGS